MSIPKGYKFGKRKSPPPFTEGHRKHISECLKGKMPKHLIAGWNKGLTKENNSSMRKLSELQKGRKLSEETRRKISLARIGKPNPYKRGMLNNFWNGGTTPIRTRIWQSYRYSMWRRDIFKQDNYACVVCGARNGRGKMIRLEADHYPVPFVYFVKRTMEQGGSTEEILDKLLDNNELWRATGRTLCKVCHDKTKWGRGTLRNAEAEMKESKY